MDTVIPELISTKPAESRSHLFHQAVDDAELLLRYAAESGADLPADAGLDIARMQRSRGACTAEEEVAFYRSYAVLAAKLRPVTVATLRVTEQTSFRMVRRMGCLSLTLAVVVIACSIITFLTTAIATDIEAGIGHANELAVSMRNRVGPPEAAIPFEQICMQPDDPPARPIAEKDSLLLTGELQDFSATMRELLNSAIKLEKLIPQKEVSPLDTPDKESAWRTRPREMLQLHPEMIDQRAETFCKIYAYEDVRSFAKNVRADSVAVYGALAVYFLPVLYALLGASAYAMRDLSERLRRRTYHPASAAGIAARTIAAVTAGAIISLFGSLGSKLSLSPLALAFLVGYGVEAFFAFLDGMLQMFQALPRDKSQTDPPRR